MSHPRSYRKGAGWLGAGVAIALGLNLPAIAAPAASSTAPNAASNSATRSAPEPAIAPPAAASSTSSSAPEQAVTPTSADEISILTPAPNAVLDQPATSLTIQYPLGAKVDVFVNNTAADRGLIGRTETNQTTHRVTETWYGIILNPGKNQIDLKRAGETKTAASVEIEVSGQPAKIKVSSLETHVPADGRSTVTILGELQDAEGHPSSWSADVTLDTTAGEFVGSDENPDAPGFQVKVNKGRFTALLRSTTQAETVRVRAKTGELEGYYQFQFETPVRKAPLATGVVDFRLGARGTNYYDSFQNFLPPDRNNSTIADVKGAAFATTSIGKWLFTGAINSTHSLNQEADGRSSLLGTSPSSDQIYPTYGDNSTTEKVTPSQDSLYLKLERTSPIKNAGSDYFMWGDFNTSEFATPSQEFTATSRALHGFKANYNLGALQLSALYSNTVQGFQRDTIAPDGTSGFYFVSQRNLVNGSENIFLELEEANRPGTVVATQQLARDSDYTIDYNRGSLLFRNPVLRTDTAADGTLLVRRIVVTYQYDSPGQNTSLVATRARYHFSRQQDRESWLGGTYWREDRGAQQFELYGADAKLSLGKKASVIAEYAHSMNSQTGTGAVSGAAYRVVAQGQLLKGITGQAFYRTAEAGFSNNATVSFVPGQTRYGVSLSGQVTPKTRVSVQVDHEDNFGIAPQILSDLDLLLNPGSSPQPGTQQNNSLTTISASVDRRLGPAVVGLKYSHLDRSDRIANTQYQTDQLQGTLAVPLQRNLDFKALAAINLSGSDPIYTNHVQAGLAWKINPNISIGLNEHYFWSGSSGDRAVTTLDTIGHYDLFKNTQLTGRFSLLGGPDGMTGQGAVGIKQGWAIAPGLKLNVAYEYVMGNFSAGTAAGPQFLQPYAVGSGASALSLDGGHNFSLGIDYTDNPDWKASFHYQYRTSSSGVNSALTGDLQGKLTSSLTGLVSYQQAGAANQLLGLLGNTADFKVGLAYRNPKDDSFNALLRYEFRNNPSTTPDTILLGSGTGSTDHTLSVEGIYAPDWRWELYGKVGYRHSTSYLANDFVSSSSILLGQLRATYRFGYRWDVTAEGRIIDTLSTGTQEYGATAEVGYYVTPSLRLAAGYAWGAVSDRDFNNSRSAGGPFLGVTVKLDQLFDGFRLLKKKPRTDAPAQSAAVSAESTAPIAAAPSATAPSPEIPNSQNGTNP